MVGCQEKVNTKPLMHLNYTPGVPRSFTYTQVVNGIRTEHHIPIGMELQKWVEMDYYCRAVRQSKALGLPVPDLTLRGLRK